MLNNKNIKISVIFCFIYIISGVIIFPQWYYQVLQNGGVGELIYQAQNTYFVWNIIATAILFLLIFTLNSIEKNHTALYQSIQNATKNKFIYFLIWSFILIASYRLLSVGLQQNIEGYNRIIEKFDSIEQPQKNASIISPPIETIYLDENRIKNIYNQIIPSLEISEKNIGTKKSNSINGSLGNKDLANISSDNQNETEEQIKLQKRSISIDEMLINSIKFLDKNKKISVISPIEVLSPEINNLINAESTFTDYGISIDKVQFEHAKNKISSKYLQNRINDSYKINSWVLLSGEMSISKSKDGKNTIISYNYMPGYEPKIEFTCSIPVNKFKNDIADSLLNESSWNISIFGKIIRISDKPDLKYTVNCLALYR